MALQDFLNNKKGIEKKPVENKLNSFLTNKGIRPTTPRATSSGSLSSFISSDTDNKPKTESVPAPKIKKESKLKDAFRAVGKELSKPLGVLAVEVRGAGNALGNLMSIASPRVSFDEGTKRAAQDIIKAQKKAINVVKGEEETSFYKELKESRDESGRGELDAIEKTMAVGADFVLDPLYAIKPVKIVKKIGEVTKLNKPATLLADLVAKSKPGKAIRTIFSNTTGNKEFDTIVSKFRTLATAREGALLDDAVMLQKDIKKFGKGAESVITEGLENKASRASITDKTVLNTVENLEKVYSGMLDKARSVGLKVGEIVEYAPHIRTKESFSKNLASKFGLGAREFGTGGVEKSRKLEGTIKELTSQGIYIFEKNPAIQLVKKGQMFAKAITSKEFAMAVEKFAKPNGVEVTNKLLKGMKFEPEVAAVIDNFYQGIQPKEIKAVIKGFDKIQNLWKAQALVSPSYHLRNGVGNLWNNYLANVNPWAYGKAALIQKGILKADDEMKLMKDLGVIDQGWYAKDIGEEMLKRVDGIGNWKNGINPLSQENYAFKANRAIGTVVENNARMAHYLSKRASGLSPEKAAESVKKYLFDYSNLTAVEKNIFKRVAPFYTWTSRNLPLQLTELVSQPGKFVLPTKIVNLLESGVEVPNERYMSPYITESIPVRVRKNEEGNTEYFLLGQWLPYASALDVLSQPLETLKSMTSPLIKTPYEQMANQSTFFKDTLGDPQKLERSFKEQGEFLSQALRKKNIALLKNIRILNDIDKMIDKEDPTATNDTWPVKLMNLLVGKAATYDVEKSKYFYDSDTEERLADYKKAIKTAEKKKDKEKADQLRQEMKDFIELRKGQY